MFGDVNDKVGTIAAEVGAAPQEENQFYTLNSYFTDDKAEQSFFVAGKEITAKQVADVLHLLPEGKHKAVLLYCFFEMSNVC